MSDPDWIRDRADFVADRDTSPGPLAEQFALLTTSLLTTKTAAGVLQELSMAAVRFLPGADMVSVTLRDADGRLHTPVATDQLAVRLDHVQYDNRRGPCADAVDPAGPAFSLSNDLASNDLWPEFAAASVDLGFHAVLSTALPRDPQPPELSGALNVYSRNKQAFNAADRDVMLLLATHGSLALSTSRAITTAQLQAEHLRKAIDSRDVIGQAKGILMQRRKITADAAFDVLRETSQSLNVKLADLAKTLADRHTELDT
ncbi:GAF and ANTAR domain-containing protein [Kibdelosporangium phytohabitans]|uniref:Histidine kinase n=1 Tax=Kibdelosporangium phytohabitans TaxID=860235 RepID=A0A0N9I7H9_9PSEU|nr:GAF and ANTAR domain-containing protein [Kibdelosporangium phytohabitans]ALG10853.1 histidine kinase [Kibdelosporangium phytohabitans]MBE1462033.1 GAF domain-containing protein [Kibdelosporangium phytohabitans]